VIASRICDPNAYRHGKPSHDDEEARQKNRLPAHALSFGTRRTCYFFSASFAPPTALCTFPLT